MGWAYFSKALYIPQKSKIVSGAQESGCFYNFIGVEVEAGVPDMNADPAN
jgi:hypothetical protein